MMSSMVGMATICLWTEAVAMMSSMAGMATITLTVGTTG